MSYVQGTTVRLEADFSDPVTRAPVVPDDITLTIKPPTAAAYTRTRSGGQVLADPLRTGRFYYELDTSPEPGTWEYQFDGVGGVTAARIVERKRITVTKRLAAA